jgi:RNase P subunit RPR2
MGDSTKQILLVFAVFVFIIYRIIITLKRRFCPKCKKFFAGKFDSKICISSDKRTSQHYDYKANKKYKSTLTEGKYKIYRKCKYCGNEYSYTISSIFSRRNK